MALLIIYYFIFITFAVILSFSLYKFFDMILDYITSFIDSI